MQKKLTPRSFTNMVQAMTVLNNKELVHTKKKTWLSRRNILENFYPK